MAALKMRENLATGTLTLEPATGARLGNLAFGLMWLVMLAVLLLPSVSGKTIDWINVILVLVFALVPFTSAFLAALVSASIVIDRTSRSLARVRRFVFVPLSTTTYSFNELDKIELQGYRPPSQNARVAEMWLVNAVMRDGKRIQLNRQGTEEEMQQLAQKVSNLTGVRWEEVGVQFPTAIKTVLEKIAPEQMKELEQTLADKLGAPIGESEPAEMPMSTATTVMNEPASALESVQPTAPLADSVHALATSALEKRVAENAMDSDARYALARKVHANGQVDRAIGLYQETLRIDPTNSEAQNDLGVALQSRGKRAEAEAAYRRAIALDPFSFTAHLNLALLLSALNRGAEASQEFYQTRKNARGNEETRLAEAASTGTKMPPRLSKV